MKHPIKLMTRLILSLGILISAPSFSEPPNLTIIKQKVITYHDSGQYHNDIKKVISQAQNFIQQQLAANKTKAKMAIVLDIDETSLSNYDHIADRDFTNNHRLIFKDMQKADATAIRPTLALYNVALKNNIKVFFVTGRREPLRQATINNLKHAGYSNWAGLYMRPEQESSKSIIPFKSRMRKAISEQGYLIIANIGDQCSDIKGGYALQGFKLPNPYYYLP